MSRCLPTPDLGFPDGNLVGFPARPVSAGVSLPRSAVARSARGHVADRGVPARPFRADPDGGSGPLRTAGGRTPGAWDRVCRSSRFVRCFVHPDSGDNDLKVTIYGLETLIASNGR